jgi:hypothetical protein
MAVKKPMRLAAPPPRRGAPAQKRIPVGRVVKRRERTPVLNNTIYAGLIVTLMFVMLPTALVLVIGGLPTLVAVVVDRHPRHYLTRCVGFLNFAGVAPYLVKIWMNHTTLAAIQLLTNPYAWLVMYSSAALGWIVYLSAPSIAWLQVELTGVRRAKALKARQRQLIEEWGDEVAEAAGATPKPASGA